MEKHKAPRVTAGTPGQIQERIDQILSKPLTLGSERRLMDLMRSQAEGE